MNSDDQNILPGVEPETPLEAVTDVPNVPVYDNTPDMPKPRRGVRFFTVLFWSFLAAIFGAAGGAVLSPYAQDILPIKTAQAEEKQLQAKLAKIERTAKSRHEKLTSEMEALTQRLSAPEDRPVAAASDIPSGGNPVANPDVMARIEALEKSHFVSGGGAEISALEDRLSALEAAEGPQEPVDLTPLEERLSALEDAQTETAADGNFKAAIITRVEALENAPAPDLTPVDLSAITARLDALETKRAAAEAARAAAPVPPFPSEAVITAMSIDPDAKKGWLARTMNKHVKVRDESAVEMVQEIEGLLTEGRISAAVTRAENLPVDGVKAAQDWIDLVKTQRVLP